MFSASTKSAHPSGSVNYIDDVFSTWLYTGNGSTQTITNGIDISGEGGLTWIKSFTVANGHALYDTNRGANNLLRSNDTSAEEIGIGGLTSFNSNGFSLNSIAVVNQSSAQFTSWTFRKQPKFFDVVTYNGNDTYGHLINHSLGSAPGCIIIKHTSGMYSTDNWVVWHRSSPSNAGALNTTDAFSDASNLILSNGVTSTTFQVGGDSKVNRGDGTYVAYLFAHDAGGFGTTGTDNVISCGSFTDTGSAFVSLGYEPQWVLTKDISSTSNWNVGDIMRGLPTSPATGNNLSPNLADAAISSNLIQLSATGFTYNSGTATGNTIIYIAIRRPQKPPTTGTQVFNPVAYTGTNVDFRLVDTGIVTDMAMARIRTASSTGGFYIADRLRGSASLGTAITTAQNTDADSFMIPFSGSGLNSFTAMNGFAVGNDITRQLNQSSTAQLAYAFKRASGFFDVVTYTGTGAVRTVNHNLGVAPELIIVKGRNSTTNWSVYNQNISASNVMFLNTTGASVPDGSAWDNTSPTSTVFTLGGAVDSNNSGSTYVAYLFATLAGVSKVGSFTQSAGVDTNVNCGFTGGARFVMIKSTASTTNDDWYVWDTARGIVSGNDPYLRVNLSNAEVTASDCLITASNGFTTNGNWLSAGNYIYLAIA